MTQVTMWIRQRDILRATFFMFGYTCCYIASHDYIHYMAQFVQYCYNRVMTQDWNHHILSNLPSIIEMTTNGTCWWSDDTGENLYLRSNVSFCSSSCQDEMEYRGRSTIHSHKQVQRRHRSPSFLTLVLSVLHL